MATQRIRAMAISMAGLVFVQCGWHSGTPEPLPETMILSAAVQGPSQVKLGWTAHTDTVTGYRVIRDGVRVTSTLVDDTQLTDFNLNAATRYCYRVIAALFPVGDVAQSNQVCITTASLADWPRATVAPISTEGSYAAMTLDASGFSHIGFRGESGVSYATDAGGSGWVTVPVDSAAGPRGDIGIGLDGLGRVHVSYYDVDRDRLMYALRSGTSWNRSSVIVGGGTVNALTVDAAGRFTILYDAGDGGELWFVNGTAGNPGTPQFVTGYSGSIQAIAVAVDTSGLLHAALAVGSGICAIRYLTETGPGTWDDTVIEPDQAACGVALVLDSGNTAHIAYMRGTDLMLATPGLTPKVVDALEYVGGADVGIAVDTADALHLSYQDINADLKYTTNASGSWTRLTLDANGNVGAHNVIGVDATGEVRIVYSRTDLAELGFVHSP